MSGAREDMQSRNMQAVRLAETSYRKETGDGEGIRGAPREGQRQEEENDANCVQNLFISTISDALDIRD